MKTSSLTIMKCRLVPHLAETRKLVKLIPPSISESLSFQNGL
jgi:hypothetical protein